MTEGTKLEQFTYKTVDDAELSVFVYSPEGHRPEDHAAAIVFFFGGGWKQGSPAQFEQHSLHLASLGMVAITVEYRVSSKYDVKIEDCISDAKSSMRWVHGHAAELGIDKSRIVVAGGSAGGHLAAATQLIEGFDAEGEDASISTAASAMVLFNPALVLGAHERLPDEIGSQIEENMKDRIRGQCSLVSPFNYVDSVQPPCVMFFGTEDRLLSGAECFCEYSRQAGNICDIVLYEGQGHAFFNYRAKGNKYYDLTLAETVAFLRQHEFLPAAVKQE